MSDDIESIRRRQSLRGMLKLITTVILIAMAWVSVSFFSTTSDTGDAFPQLRVPLTEISENKPLILKWNQRPVLIMKRSAEVVESLKTIDDELLRLKTDYKDDIGIGLDSNYRSHRPGVFVVYSSGTDFGCPIEYIPSNNNVFLGKSWPGGFRDTCRGSRYDLGGRVFIEQNAEKNLLIPPYKIKVDTVVLGMQ